MKSNIVPIFYTSHKEEYTSNFVVVGPVFGWDDFW